jgi:hypothetical protein
MACAQGPAVQRAADLDWSQLQSLQTIGTNSWGLGAGILVNEIINAFPCPLRCDS